MGDSISFLITVLYEGLLVECALKIKRDSISEDCQEYCYEPENLATFHSLLPEHVKNMGPIVNIKEIFEISDISKKPE